MKVERDIRNHRDCWINMREPISLSRVRNIALILLVNHLVWIIVWQIDPVSFGGVYAYTGYSEFYVKLWIFGYMGTGMMWLYLEESINGKVQVKIEHKREGL